MEINNDLERLEAFLLQNMESGKKKKQKKVYARVLGYVKALKDQHLQYGN